MEGEKVRRNLFQHTKPRWKPRRRWGRGRAFRPSCGRRTCRSKGTASPSPSPWASSKPCVQSRSVPVYPKTHNFQNEFQYPMEQTFMPLLSFLTPFSFSPSTPRSHQFPMHSHQSLSHSKLNKLTTKQSWFLFLGIPDPQITEKSTEIRLYYTEKTKSPLYESRVYDWPRRVFWNPRLQILSGKEIIVYWFRWSGSEDDDLRVRLRKFSLNVIYMRGKLPYWGIKMRTCKFVNSAHKHNIWLLRHSCLADFDVGWKNGTSISHSLTSGNYDQLFLLT